MIPTVSIAPVEPRRMIGRPLWYVADRLDLYGRLNVSGWLHRLGSRPVPEGAWVELTPPATAAGDDTHVV